MNYKVLVTSRSSCERTADNLHKAVIRGTQKSTKVNAISQPEGQDLDFTEVPLRNGPPPKRPLTTGINCLAVKA